MLCPEIGIEVPESLVIDFASDPESPYEKALKKLNDPGWRPPFGFAGIAEGIFAHGFVGSE